MHILVVDDEESVRFALQEVLEHAGHRVCCAFNGEAALRMMRLEKPDLVLLDMLMPGIDGWEVARERLEDPELRKIPIIIWSVLDADEIRRRGSVNVLTGISVILPKTVGTEKLLDAIGMIGALHRAN